MYNFNAASATAVGLSSEFFPLLYRAYERPGDPDDLNAVNNHALPFLLPLVRSH